LIQKPIRGPDFASPQRQKPEYRSPHTAFHYRAGLTPPRAPDFVDLPSAPDASGYNRQPEYPRIIKQRLASNLFSQSTG
jgi:hypothetical protein